MEDETPLLFNIRVDAGALKIVVKGMRHYLEKWPGGDPTEQVSIQNMLFELNKAHLELQYIEDGM